MSLEDRLAFIEGKKAELASIFENQVWEIELHPEKVDWNRVMKARFVLKWSADNNDNGNPRAKHVWFFKDFLIQIYYEESLTHLPLYFEPILTADSLGHCNLQILAYVHF